MLRRFATVFLPGLCTRSTQLPTGHYNVRDRTGTDVEVTIASKGKQPATAKAQVVNEKHGQVGVITKRINGIEFLESICSLT